MFALNTPLTGLAIAYLSPPEAFICAAKLPENKQLRKIAGDELNVEALVYCDWPEGLEQIPSMRKHYIAEFDATPWNTDRRGGRSRPHGRGQIISELGTEL